MEKMYNQYNPYLNRFYGQQQANIPQTMELPQQPQSMPQIGLNRAFLSGKQVDSIDTVKSMDIPLDGSISYFPLTDGSAIVSKQLQTDGTSKVIIYRPSQEEKKEAIKFATLEDLEEAINDIDLSDIQDLKDEIKDIKKQLKEFKVKKGKDD